MTDSGPGATMPNGNGSYSYGLMESGDWKSGSLSQTETGQDRYSPLQGFTNVSNAAKGTPGNLEYSPFGLPFSDASPNEEWDVLEEIIGPYNQGFDDEDIEAVASRLGYSHEEAEALIHEYLECNASATVQSSENTPSQQNAGSFAPAGGWWFQREGISYVIPGWLFGSGQFYSDLTTNSPVPTDKPIPSGAVDPGRMAQNQPLPAELTAGATLERGNKDWANQAGHHARAATLAIINVGAMVVPGPEVAAFKIFAQSKGFQLLEKGGKWILAKVLRNAKGEIKTVETVAEKEAEALFKEYQAAKGIRKITKGKWGAQIDYNTGRQTAMNHIRDGHFYNSRPGTGSSRFSQANSSPNRVKSLVDDAILNGNHTLNSRGDYSVIHTFDDIIGTDISGRKTKTIQIFLDEQGNVLNAYPITAP